MKDNILIIVMLVALAGMLGFAVSEISQEQIIIRDSPTDVVPSGNNGGAFGVYNTKDCKSGYRVIGINKDAEIVLEICKEDTVWVMQS